MNQTTGAEVRASNHLAQVEDRARDIVVEHLGVTPDQVTRDARFLPEDGQPHEPADGHLGADSLDVVELVMAFEDEFNVEITDAEAEAIVTFGDAVDLIAAKESDR